MQSNRIAAMGGFTKAVDPWGERERAIDLLAEAGARLMEKSGVQVLILGCLSFLGLAEPISRRLGVPVIDAAVAAVSLAESLVRQGLTTSRRAYPAPPKRQRSWSGGEM